MFVESEVLELKRELTEDIVKEVIAFANTKGGKIIIGVDDRGEVVGVEDSKKVCEAISSKIRDSIKPSILGIVSIGVENIEEKEIIVVDISMGANRPYYIESKGLKSSGVFVRLGNISIPASENLIRVMIRDTDKVRFEETISLNQDLHFEYAKKIFLDKGLLFENENMITLGLKTKEGIYTNLGLILSDECEHTIKVAVFADDTKDRFLDRKEFSGSLFKQLSETYDYICLNNKVTSTYKGIFRVDTRAYDDFGLREALLNAIVHRDYSFDGSIIVNIYNRKIEFVSIGGLMPGIDVDDIMIGISQTRNKKLANVFYRLELVESYGTGVKKILSDYEDYIKKPEFTVTNSAFLLTLPNRVNESESISESNDKYEMKKIMSLLEKEISLSRQEIQDKTQLKRTEAITLIRNLINSGYIKQIGNGKNIKYQKK